MVNGTGRTFEDEFDRVRRMVVIFGSTQCPGRSAVYQALAEAVADSRELLELIILAPGEQRRPSLLFASVNRLLADDNDHELASYYPIHGGYRPVDHRLVPSLADFCRRHEAELSGLFSTRSTQTNEIRSPQR